jgi:hypothetical protein
MDEEEEERVLFSLFLREKELGIKREKRRRAWIDETIEIRSIDAQTG